MKWEDLSHLQRGNISRKILEALEKEDFMIPADIAKVAKVDRGNISNKLTELLRRGMIELKNPTDKKFRYYSITSYGKEVLKKVKEIH